MKKEALAVSVFVEAETLVRSHQKMLIFVIKNDVSRNEVFKKHVHYRNEEFKE